MSVCNIATRNKGTYRVTHRENYGFRNSGASAIKTWGNHETLMIAPPLSETSSFSNSLMLVAFYSARSPSFWVASIHTFSEKNGWVRGRKEELMMWGQLHNYPLPSPRFILFPPWIFPNPRTLTEICIQSPPLLTHQRHLSSPF